MSNKFLNILVITIILSIATWVIYMIVSLSWATYQQETMCRDYYKGNTEKTKALILDKSISVDGGCPHPFLAYSTKIGDIDMVKFLVKNGAAIEGKFTYKSPKVEPYRIKHTPLFYAINDRYERTKINSSLEIDENYIAALEILMQNGASLYTPCGREYKETASDSLKTAYRKESPDTQTALEVIQLINHPLLNKFAEKHKK